MIFSPNSAPSLENPTRLQSIAHSHQCGNLKKKKNTKDFTLSIPKATHGIIDLIALLLALEAVIRAELPFASSARLLFFSTFKNNIEILDKLVLELGESYFTGCRSRTTFYRWHVDSQGWEKRAEAV